MDGGLSPSSILHGLGSIRTGQWTSALTATWHITQIVAAVLVLIAERGRSCDQKLNLWLIVSTCRVVLRLALSSVALKMSNAAWAHMRPLLLFMPPLTQAQATERSPAGPRPPTPARPPTPPRDALVVRIHPEGPPTVRDAGLSAERGSARGERRQRQGWEVEGGGEERGEEGAAPEEGRGRRRRPSQDRRAARATATVDAEAGPRTRGRTSAGAPHPDEGGQGPSMLVEKAREILDIFALIWFTLGNAWVFGSRYCRFTSPGIFYVSLGIIVMTYVTMLFPVLLALLFVPFACFCMPCFLRLAIQLQAQDRASRGASSAEINALPVVKFVVGMFDGAEAGTCAICLAEYEEGEALRLLQCPGKHHFHVGCVDQWLR